MKLYKIIRFTTHAHPRPGTVWYAVGEVTRNGYERVTAWEEDRNIAVWHLKQLRTDAQQKEEQATS